MLLVRGGDTLAAHATHCLPRPSPPPIRQALEGDMESQGTAARTPHRVYRRCFREKRISISLLNLSWLTCRELAGRQPVDLR